ncbi:LapA family protein [Fructilactobacillus sp. Tb1]|uniref:LapA family protein n=1 Tax=Fructilactobacillus sp. Tb1 TaxID=3422304 RepID=UPI003D27C4FB
MKKQVYVISGLVLIILIAIFVLLNMADTVVSFGFATVKMPLILVVLASLLLGALLIFLFSSMSSFQNSRQNKASQKQIKQLQAQVEELQAQIGAEVETESDKKDSVSKELDDKHDAK